MIIAEFWINWRFWMLVWKFSISSSSWSTWKRDWWSLDTWFFRISIIYFAYDTSIITFWLTAKKISSSKKVKTNFFRNEKMWCMLQRNQNFERFETRFRINKICLMKIVWNIWLTFTFEIIVVVLLRRILIKFCILKRRWAFVMRLNMLNSNVIWRHQLMISKRWLIALI
jgi:hypothetical protein